MDYIRNMLFKPLDREKTARNVSRFFKKDYATMVERAGEAIWSPKSPSFDGMPKAPSFENTSDRRMIEQMEAQYERDLVVYTVNCLDAKSCMIITEKYLVDDPALDFEIYQKMGYGKTRFTNLKKDALIKFAEAYQSLDLRVFQK